MDDKYCAGAPPVNSETPDLRKGSLKMTKTSRPYCGPDQGLAPNAPMKILPGPDDGSLSTKVPASSFAPVP